ncbi:MAG: hypothetical protein KDG49_17570, partial [Geminicoccaceae bacterium]|nr:hypothetical protein [Geminicoccaceae bacterium]
MINRNHWSISGFSAMALLALSACSGGGGGSGGGTPSTPSGGGGGGGGGTPPVVDFAVPNPYATAGSESPDKLGRLFVFGDS